MAKYSKELLESIVKESFSIAQCLRSLGKRPVGANYKTFNRKVKLWCIDTSHFKGQGWRRNRKFGRTNRSAPLKDILVENSSYTSTNELKKRLFEEGLKDRRCEECANTEWNRKPIPLELEHCNGINTDHRIENLKILCPNCHAQTPHYRGKNKRSSLNERRGLNYVKFGEVLVDSSSDNPEPSLPNKQEGVETLRRKPKVFICACGEEMSRRAKKCRSCELISRTSLRPSVMQLMQDHKELNGNFVQLGKKYGVSDNAVRKWFKLYKLDI